MADSEKKIPEQPPDNVGSNDNVKKTKNHRPYQRPGGKAAFEGKCDDLKGHIYDCANASKAADMYTKTTREIAEYIGRTIKYSAAVVKGIETLTKPTIPMPEALPDTATAYEKKIWDKRVDKAIEEEYRLKDITSRGYAIVWGQCSDALREKIKAHKEYHDAHDKGSVVDLLKIIKTEMFTFQTQKYGPQAMHEAKRRFYMLRQDKHTSVQQYYETFTNTVEVIEHCGGGIGTDHSLVTEMLGGTDRAITSEAAMTNAEKLAKEKYLACAFILGSDKTRYGKLVEDLENAFTQGDDKFPKDMVSAYNLLVNWKQNPQNYVRIVDGSSDGAMFVTDAADDEAENNAFTGKCWICKKPGHRKNQCPERVGTQLLMSTEDEGDDADATTDCGFTFNMTASEFLFQQQSHDENLRKWILLDNQSTVNVFCNSNLVKNIRVTPNPLLLKCNAGTIKVNKIADLPGYPEPVWYHDKGITNVLSLSRVAKLFPVTFENNGFIIHKPDGRKHLFKESARGLFYLDTADRTKNTMMVMTVAENKERYTARDYQRAELARKI